MAWNVQWLNVKVTKQSNEKRLLTSSTPLSDVTKTYQHHYKKHKKVDTLIPKENNANNETYLLLYNRWEARNHLLVVLQQNYLYTLSSIMVHVALGKTELEGEKAGSNTCTCSSHSRSRILCMLCIWPFKHPNVYSLKIHLLPAFNWDRRVIEQRRLFLYCMHTCQYQDLMWRPGDAKMELWLDSVVRKNLKEGICVNRALSLQYARR